MSFSNEFDQIKEMRRQDDPTLDQGEWVTTLKVADWLGTSRVCADLLSTRTKDLRLAMWLTEAWSLTQGYGGMAKGLQLCTQLCEHFWNGLHPQPDGGDFEERIGNIGWLLHRVTGLSHTLPFTQGRQGSAYSLRDLAGARQQAASAPERDPYGQERPPAPDALTLEQFNRALKETSAAHLLETVQAARQCQAHLWTWQQVIDGHLGADGPGFVQAKEALASALHELERLAREAGALGDGHYGANGADGPGGEASQETADAADASGTPASASSGGPLRSRAQALQQLRDVANFFRRTEPHSPVAYLADKAVKWGEMPLHEWLRKVIKDQGSMSHLEELLGLDQGEGSPH